MEHPTFVRSGGRRPFVSDFAEDDPPLSFWGDEPNDMMAMMIEFLIFCVCCVLMASSF
jgi:hypothetical protein